MKICLFETADGRGVSLDASKVTFIVEMDPESAKPGDKPQIYDRARVHFVSGESLVVRSSYKGASAAILGPASPPGATSGGFTLSGSSLDGPDTLR